jgi:hypothetical protein
MNIEDAWDSHMRRAHLDVAQEQPAPASRPHKAPLARRAMQVSIALVCAWSIVETPNACYSVWGRPRFSGSVIRAHFSHFYAQQACSRSPLRSRSNMRSRVNCSRSR